MFGARGPSASSLAAQIYGNYIAFSVSRIYLPTSEDRGREGPSLDDVCKAKLLVAVRRRFNQDQISRFGQHQQLSADRNQPVKPELRLLPLDISGLPIQATQRSGRASCSLRVVADRKSTRLN